jgi:hypothetical protein
VAGSRVVLLVAGRSGFFDQFQRFAIHPMLSARLTHRHHQTAIRPVQAGPMDVSPAARSGRWLAALTLLAAVAGCGSVSEQLGSSIWVAPGKYTYHNCLQAQQVEAGFASRQKELEELMGRAAQGPGGQAIGTMVYRTEYQQVLGERKALAALFEEKRCGIESKRSSDRSMF